MSLKESLDNLAEGVLAGDRRAVGQAISACENDTYGLATEDLAVTLWPHTGQAMTVGITGPPGVGKSTLTSGLADQLRTHEKTVGIVAVDPSSTISHGALLGDRIRMTQHALDPGVFIRSMSARGHLGGIAEATFPAMMVLDAAGMDVVLVETVGVGQSETEVRSLVDTLIVTVQPDSGDSVQLMKSGLLEVPDIICLNKSDRSGAETTKRNLKSLVQTEYEDAPLYTETNALEGDGIDTLWAAVEQHRKTMGTDGLRERRLTNFSQVLANLATARLATSIVEALSHETGSDLANKLEAREINPYQAVSHLLYSSK